MENIIARKGNVLEIKLHSSMIVSELFSNIITKVRPAVLSQILHYCKTPCVECNKFLSFLYNLNSPHKFIVSLRAGQPGVRTPVGANTLSSPYPFRWVLGPTYPSLQWVPRIFHRGKEAGAWR